MPSNWKICDWRLSHLRRLILVTYASSQWRGKKFLIEHVVNVKATLNGSEHDGRSFKRWYGFYAFTGGREHFIFLLLKLKMLEAKVKFWCGTHMTQLFLKKFLIFTNFRRERTVFHFIFKENGKSEAVFQHFWSAMRQFFFERGVTQIWSLFYCKTDNLSCLNKTNCLVNCKVKGFFMCFYVISRTGDPQR